MMKKLNNRGSSRHFWGAAAFAQLHLMMRRAKNKMGGRPGPSIRLSQICWGIWADRRDLHRKGEGVSV